MFTAVSVVPYKVADVVSMSYIGSGTFDFALWCCCFRRNADYCGHCGYVYIVVIICLQVVVPCVVSDVMSKSYIVFWA
jgi:hypothetical protein